MDKKIYSLGYVTWFLGLAFIVAIDWSVRKLGEQEYGLGMPEPVWFISQIALSLIAALCIYFSLRNSNRREAVLYGLSAILVGVLYYMIVVWLYVIGTGVDSV